MLKFSCFRGAEECCEKPLLQREYANIASTGLFDRCMRKKTESLNKQISSINKLNSKPFAAFVVPIKCGHFFENDQN